MSAITVTSKDLREAIKGLKTINKNIPKAFVSALNRAAQGVRTEAARKVREIYYVKHGEILKKIKVSKATSSRIAVVLESKDRAIRLINFRTNPKRIPARVPRVLKAGVKRQGGKKPIPGAFVANVRGGHVGVFQRTSYAKHRKTTKGYWSQGPIDQLRGPAIPVMLSQPGVIEHIQQQAEERVIQRLDHEMQRQVFGKVNL